MPQENEWKPMAVCSRGSEHGGQHPLRGHGMAEGMEKQEMFMLHKIRLPSSLCLFLINQGILLGQGPLLHRSQDTNKYIYVYFSSVLLSLRGCVMTCVCHRQAKFFICLLSQLHARTLVRFRHRNHLGMVRKTWLKMLIKNTQCCRPGLGLGWRAT